MEKTFTELEMLDKCIRFANFYRMWYGHPSIGCDAYTAYRYWANLPELEKIAKEKKEKHD